MGARFLDDDSLTFHEFNRGKRSVVLDLKTDAGIRALHELAERADVLVHNLRPDVPEALGIDPEHFCERHPRLIYCEISGFGARGPMRNDPAFEPLVQAVSGMITINGDPSAPPSRLPISAVDLGTGMWTVIGMLAALRRRDTTGRGCVVQTSLFDTAMGWLAQRVDPLVNQDVELPREPMSGHSGLVPYQTFPATDGDFMVCVGNDRPVGKVLHRAREARMDRRSALRRQPCAARKSRHTRTADRRGLPPSPPRALDGASQRRRCAVRAGQHAARGRRARAVRRERHAGAAAWPAARCA